MRSVKRFSVMSWTTLSTLFLILISTSGSVIAGSLANPVEQLIKDPSDCMADIIGQTLSCTSNDIQLASGAVVDVVGSGFCQAGDLVEVRVSADLQMNAGKDRYDVILWSSLSAQNIQVPTGGAPAQCWSSSLSDIDGNGLTSPFIADLEASEDYTNINGKDEFQATQANIRDPLDQCRDIIADGTDPLITQNMTSTQNLFLPCIDTDGDGFVNAQFMVTWANNPDTISACGSGGATIGEGLAGQLTSKCDAVSSNLNQIQVINPATLTIVKTTTSGNGVFDFATTGFAAETVDAPSPFNSIATPNAFSLDTGVIQTDSLTDNNIIISDTINGDPFSVIEDEAAANAAGFELTSATCTNGQTPDALTLLPGDVVTCTFVNAPQGTVTFNKIVIGDIAEIFNFSNDLGGSHPDPFPIAVVGGSGSYNAGVLPSGTYTITEDDPTLVGVGFDFTSLVCTDTTDNTTVLDRTVTLVVDPGDTISCDFTNTAQGSIIVKKLTLPSGSLETFTFTGDVAGTPIADGGENRTDNLSPGAYQATEDAKVGWDLTSIVCDDQLSDTPSTGDPGTGIANFNVDPGEVVTCTFVNTQRGSIEVVKSVTPIGANTQAFTFTSAGDFFFDGVGGALTTLDLTPASDVANATSTAIEVLPASTYTVSETVPTGWSLVAATCDDGSDPLTGIDVAPGENVVCTFTNSLLGSSTIVKTAIGGDDTFTYTGDAPFNGLLLATAGGTASQDFTNVLDPTLSPYTLDEDALAGWELTNVVCADSLSADSAPQAPGGVVSPNATINVDFDESVTCTFTNTADSTLVIEKQTLPDGAADAFTFTTDGALFDGSGATTADLTDGTTDSITGQPTTHTVSETVLPGWAITNIACLSNGANSTWSYLGAADTPTDGFEPGDSFVTVIMAAGETVTCRFENTKLGTIKVIKNTIGDAVGSFPFESNLPVLGNFQLDTVGNTAEEIEIDLFPGTYMVNELAPSGWDLTDIACTSSGLNSTFAHGGDATFELGDTDAQITLVDGEDIECTFTNTQRGTITLIKNLPNDDGGDAVETDFQAYIDGNPVDWGVPQEFVPDTYTASEDTLTGYAASDWFNACATDGTVILGAGEDLTCEITNDDIAPQLTMVKSVTNDDGGVALPDEFLLTVGGASVTSGAKNTYTSNTPLALDETLLTGYSFVSITGDVKCPALLGGTVTLDEGDDIVCTITNDDIAPGLTLVKSVTNDNGGTAVITDWTLAAAGPTPISGVSGSAGVTGAAVEAGAYTLSESGGPAGYTAGDWSCVGGSLTGSTLTIDSGENAVCTIVNDDDTAVLTLVKTVTNDDEGTAVETDWTLSAAGPTPITGVTATPAVTAVDVDAGVYTLSESGGPTGYVAGAWSCTAGALVVDQLTLANGETAVCTINNDDEPAAINLAKTVNGPAVRQPGGTYTVVYTITATNTGQGPGVYDLIDAFTPGVGITLDTATAVYLAGTENDQSGTLGAYPNFVTDEALAASMDESWTVTAIFSIDLALVTAEGNDCDPTNTGAENTGFTNGVTGSSTDTDLTDNIACTDFIPPAISLDKTSDVPTYETVGDVINYDYLITNLGPDVLDPGLSSVVDDKDTVTCPAAAPLLVGGTVTCTASHVITQADLDAGLLTNVATAMVDDVTSNDDTVTVTSTTQPPVDPVIPVPVNDKLALLLLTLMLLATGWYFRPAGTRKF